MKSLHTVQSMMKVLKILSKIGLVFCIVGTVLSLIGGTVLVALEQNADDEYINLGKTVVLLPYANGQKFIVIGVVI